MTLLQVLAEEFVTLSSAIDSAEPDSESAEVIYERLSALSREAMQVPASTERELVWKARILLKWLEPDGDWRDDFAALLCRDILSMYDETGQREPSPPDKTKD